MLMTKSDLKTGMRVETRNGYVFVVLKDCDIYCGEHQDIFFSNAETCIEGQFYTEDLTCVSKSGKAEEWDIIKIYQVSVNEHYWEPSVLNFEETFPCVWTRDEEKDEFQMELDNLKATQAKLAERIAILEDKLT